jgi:hypothetical protein
VDSRIAQHLRNLFGEQVDTQGWGIEAEPDFAHCLRARITMPHSEVLPVIERLIPHVRAFSAVIGTHRGAPGVEISATLMIDIREIVSIMDNKE